MFNELSHLTKRESIIYFFQKFTNGKLNRNCNNREFYENRGYGFIYDYIINYFDEIDDDLKKLNLTQKYYHIFTKLNEFPKNNKFINFYSGYVGIPKKTIFDRTLRINYENVLSLKYRDIYSIEYVKDLLKDPLCSDHKGVLCTYPNKRLLYSIYQHTLKYKKMPFLYRVKYISNGLSDTEFSCICCGKEVDYVYLKPNKTCGDLKCISHLRSEKAKKRDISHLYTEEANRKKIQSRIGRKVSDETRQKMRESNKRVWTEEYRIKDRQMRLERGCDQKISKTMKRKILNGELTPKSENRKRAKRIKSEITGISYRSNWELIFHEDNRNLHYELIRIKYMDGDIERIYITDFVDMENKIIYEIKPTSELNESNFLNKLKYTKKWCKKNGFEFKVITEKDYNFYGRKTKP